MCLSQCFPLILQYLSRRQREKNELPRYPQCLHVPGNKPRPFQATSLSPKMKALFSLLFTQETVSEELNVFQAKEQAAEELAEPQEQCTLRLPRGEVLKLSAISPAPSFTSLVTLVTLPGCTYELEMANPTPPFSPLSILLTRLFYTVTSYSRTLTLRGQRISVFPEKTPAGTGNRSARVQTPSPPLSIRVTLAESLASPRKRGFQGSPSTLGRLGKDNERKALDEMAVAQNRSPRAM